MITESLEKKSPKIFREIVDLILKVNPARSEGDTEREVERVVGSIVSRYSRFRTLGLQEVVREASDNLQAAGILVEKALPVFQELDAKQKKSLRALLTKASGYDEAEGLEPIIERFYHSAHDLQLWGQALALATQVKPKAKKRGRPPLPTASATRELVDAWTILTGTPVVTPNTKRYRGKQSTEEPSTYFVELVLRAIFEDISASQAQTSVRNALSRRKRFASVSDDSETKDESVLLRRKIIAAYAKIRPKTT